MILTVQCTGATCITDHVSFPTLIPVLKLYSVKFLWVEADDSTYISLDLCYNSVPLLVYDGIDFLYNIKVGFIVCILYPGPPPGYVRQLTSWKSGTDSVQVGKTQKLQNVPVQSTLTLKGSEFHVHFDFFIHVLCKISCIHQSQYKKYLQTQ